MPNILLVYPENPITFWSFTESLKLLGKKAAQPPLGLLGVAALLPEGYNPRLIDMNVEPLTDEAIEGADAVLCSSMIIHKESVRGIIQRCNRLETPIMLGGPYPTQYHDLIEGNATFFLGEAENGFADALEEMLYSPGEIKRSVIDTKGQFRSLEEVPLPRYDLLDLSDYVGMIIQLTRGCPEKCTFCDIPGLYGRTTRLKTEELVIREMDYLYELGWRGSVMFADDNFVGNQEEVLMKLEKIIPWQKERCYPFHFYTQASLKMYDNPDLMEAMYQAGFDSVFIGLESPSAESLKFMGAQKNLVKGKSMLEKVLEIEKRYFKVWAGFIVGFDTDPDDISEIMIDFINSVNIEVAMVGPLGVMRGTPDYIRYDRAGRLTDKLYTGNSGIFTDQLSYIPHDRDGNQIDPSVIMGRHKKIVETLNSPKVYFKRALQYLKIKERAPIVIPPVGKTEIRGLFNSIYRQGLRGNYKWQYWSFLAKVCIYNLKDFPSAIRSAIFGHHLITITQQASDVHELNSYLDKSLKQLSKSYDQLIKGYETSSADMWEFGRELIKGAKKRYRKIKGDYQGQVEDVYNSFIEEAQKVIASCKSKRSTL